MTPSPTPTPADAPKPDDTPKPAPSAAAPEKYEAFKVPEGIALEGEALTKASELFKGLGLSQESAQSLVDFHTAQMKAIAAAPDAAFNEMTTEWRTKAAADPDIGPLDGSKAAGIRETMGRALDAIGDKALADDFKSAMNLTGVGDHPAFIKVIAKLSAALVEGRPANMTGAKPSASGQAAPDAAPRTVASALYPNLPA